MLKFLWIKKSGWDLPGSPMVKNPPANVGHTGSIPGPGGFYMPLGN